MHVWLCGFVPVRLRARARVCVCVCVCLCLCVCVCVSALRTAEAAWRADNGQAPEGGAGKRPRPAGASVGERHSKKSRHHDSSAAKTVAMTMSVKLVPLATYVCPLCMLPGSPCFLHNLSGGSHDLGAGGCMCVLSYAATTNERCRRCPSRC